MHGPPGTGKTTLCQGLAQKASIRLSATYKETRLIQINTATLLSKFYSESAKQVDEIFKAVEKLCLENPEEFICVLIDEVESIANCRETGALHGEAQDSIRATNALLTGFDRVKANPNVLILCTSNMPGSLDKAFLDRCGVKLAVDPPSAASQYTILRDRIQKLIGNGIIVTDTQVPSYKYSNNDWDIEEEIRGPGSKLMDIVELIGSANAALPYAPTISGRSLTQLPEQALLRYLREEECDLEMTLTFMKQYVLAQQSQEKKTKRAIGEDDSLGSSAQTVEEELLQNRVNLSSSTVRISVEDALKLVEQRVNALEERVLKKVKLAAAE